MTDYEALVAAYIELWNLPDQAREAKVGEVCTEDVLYTDPTVVTRGRDGLNAYISRTRERFGHPVVSLPARVDGHHRTVRFGWQYESGADGPIMAGQDFALIERGRIKAVYGFFE